MRKRFRIILAILLLAIMGGGLVWLALTPREPVYQGKPLSGWLEQYGTNHWGVGQDKAQEAEKVIRQIGTNAIPIYLDMLSTRESAFRAKLLTNIPSSWLTRLRIDRLSEYKRTLGSRRRMGAHGLIALGPDAKPAVPSLIALLTNTNKDVKYCAVFTIRCLGPVAKDALPGLITCLGDPDFAVKDDAALGLGYIQSQPERVIPELLNFLNKNRSNSILSRDAIFALGLYGPQAKVAVPAILGFLNQYDPNQDSEPRFQAAMTLGEIRSEPGIVVPTLIQRLNDPEPRMRARAAFALGRFEKEAKPAIPALIKLLNDSNPEIKYSASNALKTIDPEAAANAGVK